MKYPSVILKGDYSKGYCISIAIATNNQILKMLALKWFALDKILNQPIISKSLARKGGKKLIIVV